MDISLAPELLVNNPFTGILQEQLKRLPCNYYVVSNELILLDCNDTQAKALHFAEASDIIGTSIASLIPDESVCQVRKNNEQVVKRNTVMYFNEFFMWEDTFNSYLSLKFPFYNNNKIIGSFGISINLFDACFTEVNHFLSGSKLQKLALQSKRLRNWLTETEIDGVLVSKSEAAVLYYLIQGQTAKGIGASLHLSPRTVEIHLANLKDKLKCRNKSELITKVLNSEFYNRVC